MPTKKTIEEQIKEVQKKQEQVSERREQLLKRRSAEERKARTRRLIRIGAMVEKQYGKPLTEEQIGYFYWFLIRCRSELDNYMDGKGFIPKM